MKKMGRPRKYSNLRSIQMRLEEDFISKIDAWRRRQPDLPTRTEAVRRLVNLGLAKNGRGR